MIWSLTKRMTANSGDAEDAVQEIFLELWKNAGRFDPNVAEESTFVAMIARRRLIDRQRKSKREVQSVSLEVEAQEMASPSITSSVEISEEAARAKKCLERLKVDERKVIELSVYQSLPQSQISEKVGLPLGTVKTHVRRGLAQLRDCMNARRSLALEGTL